MIDPVLHPIAQTPIFKLLVDGKPFPSARILRIEATDAAGFESDELRLTLDDSAPQIETPREGATYELSLGYAEWGPPIFIGTYVFEEIERNGYERTLTLTAKAADHAESLKEPKTRAWEGQTFGAICGTIAREHNLKLAIASDLAAFGVAYIAQTEESDQHFLTRLGRRLGAVVAPKDGRLLISSRGSGKTVSGKPMPTIFITTQQLIADNAYMVRRKPRSRYSRVIAKWQDRAAGRTRTITLKAGLKGPSMTLREVFQSAADARKAAEAKVKELRAGEGELSCDLVGFPKARAEAPIKVQGVAPDADGDWIAASVTHIWDYTDGSGAVTTVEAEFGMEENSDKKKPTKSKKKTKSTPKQTGEYVSILDR
ncbi:phage late control D family protein [Cognatishimia sp. MH4019]|uniref:phage late control D family protein n=1 Tax=Cognatishimia sp. MH4019 TaxID=2854030 RepID=UPI001CD7576C|nr:contractile injection system protein, VgrG/Pvc8 family [Cognatishimia sp. MH4019]